MKNKSILLISNLFSVGESYGGVCKQLAAQLTNKGWKVITTSSVRNRYLRPVDMLLTTFSQRNNYHVAQIDVFSGPAFQWAKWSAWALSKLGKPFILTLRGGNLPTFAQDHSAQVKSLLNSAAVVTTPSRFLLEELKGYQQGIKLIPNPIDIAPYTYKLRTAPQPKLLYLRAFHRMYNPELAVSVIKEIAADQPTVKLTMVGPDKGDGTVESVKSEIARQNVNDQIEIVGAIPKSQVPSVMSEADIFINTTNVDNTPISVIEAMASGLCIVSTNVGGLPYLLEDEHDTLLVPHNDPEAMSNAIRRILTEPGLAEKLSRNARAKAETFDWSVVLPQWEALLTEVIEKHG